MSDTVLVSFPRDTRYYPVARLVVGGMAAPLQMSFDALDDLQLAISSLLDNEELTGSGSGPSGIGSSGARSGDVHLRLEVDTDRLVASIGSFASGSVERAFTRSGVQSGGPEGLGLRRLLDTIVDDVSVADEDGSEWISLTKHVKALA